MCLTRVRIAVATSGKRLLQHEDCIGGTISVNDALAVWISLSRACRTSAEMVAAARDEYLMRRLVTPTLIQDQELIDRMTADLESTRDSTQQRYALT